MLVDEDFVDAIIKLLRKCKIKVNDGHWERGLSKFCNTYSARDGKKIARLGFRRLRPTTKLRIIKVC